MTVAFLQTIFITAFLCASVSGPGSADSRGELASFTFYTENYPPLNYEENGVLKGLSVEILEEALRRLDVPTVPTSIVVVPWARGYKETQARPGTALFSTIRTPSREKLYKWVGPIGASNIVLVARKESDVTLANPPDFNKYTYGVVQHDRGEQALFEVGVPRARLVHTNSPMFAAHLLARGRVDLWAYERVVYLWALDKLGYEVNDFEVVHSFENAHYYIAFNRQTDDAIIALMQGAIETLRADGTMAAIVEKHMPGQAESFLNR